MFLPDTASNRLCDAGRRHATDRNSAEAGFGSLPRAHKTRLTRSMHVHYFALEEGKVLLFRQNQGLVVEQEETIHPRLFVVACAFN
jgi:hypothetical protein